MQVSAGSRHSCAIDVEGALTCWDADPLYGTPLAQGSVTSTVSARSPGSEQHDSEGDSDARSGVRVVQVEVGTSFACALTEDGQAICGGYNYYHQADAPQLTFTQLSTGSYHACGLREDQSASCWGKNDHGQTNTPPGRFIQVSAGANHSCALRDDGELVCWGRNDKGQIDSPSWTFERLDAGSNHNCAQ